MAIIMGINLSCEFHMNNVAACTKEFVPFIIHVMFNFVHVIVGKGFSVYKCLD